jgi:hypothetical protein
MPASRSGCLKFGPAGLFRTFHTRIESAPDSDLTKTIFRYNLQACTFNIWNFNSTYANGLQKYQLLGLYRELENIPDFDTNKIFFCTMCHIICNLLWLIIICIAYPITIVFYCQRDLIHISIATAIFITLLLPYPAVWCITRAKASKKLKSRDLEIKL